MSESICYWQSLNLFNLTLLHGLVNKSAKFRSVGTYFKIMLLKSLIRCLPLVNHEVQHGNMFDIWYISVHLALTYRNAPTSCPHLFAVNDVCSRYIGRGLCCFITCRLDIFICVLFCYKTTTLIIFSFKFTYFLLLKRSKLSLYQRVFASGL